MLKGQLSSPVKVLNPELLLTDERALFVTGVAMVLASGWP